MLGWIKQSFLLPNTNLIFDVLVFLKLFKSTWCSSASWQPYGDANGSACRSFLRYRRLCLLSECNLYVLYRLGWNFTLIMVNSKYVEDVWVVEDVYRVSLCFIFMKPFLDLYRLCFAIRAGLSYSDGLWHLRSFMAFFRARVQAFWKVMTFQTLHGFSPFSSGRVFKFYLLYHFCVSN